MSDVMDRIEKEKNENERLLIFENEVIKRRHYLGHQFFFALVDVDLFRIMENRLRRITLAVDADLKITKINWVGIEVYSSPNLEDGEIIIAAKISKK